MQDLVQDQLLNSNSLMTYAGLSTAVVFVTNGIVRAFKFNPAWLGLIVSLLICIAAVSTGTKGVGVQGYFIAVLNAFVVFGTAVGQNSVLGTVAEKIGTPTDSGIQGAGTEYVAPRPPFFPDWL